VIINDLDLGPNGANLAGAPLQTNTWGQPGQTIGSELVYGARTIIYPTGGQKRQRQETIYVEAPGLLGGAAPSSPGALRTLVRQLQELADNPDLNPAYVQWRAGNGVLAADPDDGWWVIENVRPDMNTEGAGWAAVEVTASAVSPASPSALALAIQGAPLSTSYTPGQSCVVAFPVGSSAQPGPGTRAGAEGVIPISFLGNAPSPYVPFARPATVAALWTGDVTCWDTQNTASNPVPTSGGFVHPSWVKVYGTGHDFTGDTVVTNGVLLLLFQPGQGQLCSVYLWDTSLGTPAWHLLGSVQWQDGSSNTGTLRSIDLDRVSPWEARLHLRASTSAGAWSLFRLRLLFGHRDVPIEFWPVATSSNQLSLLWSTASAYATGFNDTGTSTTFPSNLPVSPGSGYAAVQASATGSPVFGWLYQNPPTTAQGRLSSNTVFGYGDSAGPTGGAYKLYGIFAWPYTGTPNVITAGGLALQAWDEMMYDIRNARWVMG